ncbi:MAG: hypothetical protein ACC619_02245 [Paracoccaceae bacterium]
MYDTLDLAGRGECLIDMAGGKGLLIEAEDRTEAPFQRTRSTIDIQDRQPDIPEDCRRF